MSIGTEWGDKFGPAFVKHVHELLFWGYDDSRQYFNADTDEVIISQLIRDAIRNRLIDPNIPEWSTPFERPHLNYPITSGTRIGKDSQLVDLVIPWRVREIQFEFMLEAKRLRTNGFEIGKYTGKEGLGCFINEEYAELCPSAAMLAYVQSDDAGQWFKKLEKKFKNDAQDELKIVQQLCPCPVLKDELPNEWLSEHRRKEKPSIKIYHIFLDCQ